MKFLAILRDSVREAIDVKVFYVMAGLAALLIVLALTVSFEPAGDAEEFMRIAAVPLSVNLDEDTGLALQDPKRLWDWGLSRMGKDTFTVVKVETVEGADNHPASHYRVFLKGTFGGKRPTDDELVERIRAKFGNLLGSRVVSVTEAHVLTPAAAGKTAEIEVMTAPSGLTKRLWPHNVSLLFGAMPLPFLHAPLAGQLFVIEGILVNFVGATVALLVSVIITAFFVPNMLRKGTVDMLLVKPIHRSTLLLYKYVGGLAFILINTTITVGGVWLALELRSGVWAPAFLMTIPVLTFYFAILYALSTLFGVLTRSPIAAILLTCGFWFFLFVLGGIYNVFVEAEVIDPKQWHDAWEAGKPKEQREAYVPDGLTPDERRARQGGFKQGVRKLHFILPRTSDLGKLTSRYLASDLMYGNRALQKRLDPSPVSWGETLTVSGIFIVLMLGLACWHYRTTDY